MFNRVNELSFKIDDLFKRLNDLEAKLSKYERIDTLIDDVDKLKKEKTKIKRDITMKYNELSRELTDLSFKLFRLSNDIDWIKRSVNRRIEHKPRKYMDNESYCKLWYWYKKIEGWDMKADYIVEVGAESSTV